MTETRLNSVAVCNIHHTILDNIDLNQLMHEFEVKSDIRKSLFGKIIGKEGDR
jgi:hypothetical protein